ncbi:MAG: hypothetical protein GTO41_07955, partial [Burkholderiales bacterium]|nr:hypothetical protein [Burkholderiales bacterium]
MRMLLRRGEWDEAAIKATFAHSEQYRRHRQAQLAQVIAYAESDACRRRILLAHFGDRGPAEAIRCCDNCLATVPEPVAIISEDVTQLSRAGRTALIILDTLRNLSWNIGRTKLAQILQGSRAKEIKQFDYDQNPYYGRLAVFTQKEIRGLIDQLIEQGYLKTVGGSYPVLSLTPQGEAAPQARTAIPLRLPHQVRKKDFSELSATERARRVFQLGEGGS